MSSARTDRPGRWQGIASVCLALAPLPTVAVSLLMGGGWGKALSVSGVEIAVAFFSGVLALRRGERLTGYLGLVLSVLAAVGWFGMCWVLLSMR